MTLLDSIVLVDENDNQIGVAEKLYAYQRGLRHRAFSACIIHRVTNNMLIQKRSILKYHIPSLWSNSCCSHPRPCEDVVSSAQRRIKEELSINLSDLSHCGIYPYTLKVGNNSMENEVDHVLVGYTDIEQAPFNTVEVEECAWISIKFLHSYLTPHLTKYTLWFSGVLEKVLSKYNLLR